MSKLKELRKAQGLTQKDLAYLTGVNQRLIQDYEQGRKNINGAAGARLYRLAKALLCNIEDLLELDQIDIDN